MCLKIPNDPSLAYWALFSSFCIHKLRALSTCPCPHPLFVSQSPSFYYSSSKLTPFSTPPSSRAKLLTRRERANFPEERKTKAWDIRAVNNDNNNNRDAEESSRNRALTSPQI